MAIGKNWARTVDALKNRQPFDFGNAMTAVTGRSTTTGRMEGDDLDRYRNDEVAYTVLSYATPIAWVTRAGLVRISIAQYSQTTKQHLTLCRAWLAES